MKKSYLLFGLIAIAVVVLDQITKHLIDSRMLLHDSIPVIGGFFSITYVKNPGAAFGFLAGASPLFRAVFFIGVTLAAIILILYYMRKMKVEDALVIVPLSLILGGAVGNLIDRVRLGEVIDFLDAHWYQHHWPAFNVADSLICVGVFLLAFDMLREEKRLKQG